MYAGRIIPGKAQAVGFGNSHPDEKLTHNYVSHKMRTLAWYRLEGTAMASTAISLDISCAAEVFLATTLLHREQPNRTDFTIQEIVNRVSREGLHGELRSGIHVHASQHCVANRAPNPAKHRMLFATGKHTRRLLLPEDEIHPDRTGKIFPSEEEIPEQYRELLDWAKSRYQVREGVGKSGGTITEPKTWLADVLALRLAGAHLADGVDPDEQVRQLREGWD